MKSIFSKAFIKSAEQVSLTEDEMNQMNRGYGTYGNDEKPFAGMFKRASDSAKQKAHEAKIAELREKYSDIVAMLDDDGRNAKDILEQLAETNLVPPSGKCDTVMGEIIRAYNRIAYRRYNDGDLWFCGYGVETCASSVAYLYNTIPQVKDNIDGMVKDIDHFYKINYSGRQVYIEDTKEYDEWLNNILSEIIVEYLRDKYDLIETPLEDDVDSRDGDFSDWIDDILPKNEEWDLNVYVDGYITDSYGLERDIRYDLEYYDFDYEIDVDDSNVRLSFYGMNVNDLQKILDDNIDEDWLENIVHESEYFTYDNPDDEDEESDDE